jgi:hypothetical protein
MPCRDRPAIAQCINEFFLIRSDRPAAVCQSKMVAVTLRATTGTRRLNQIPAATDHLEHLQVRQQAVWPGEVEAPDEAAAMERAATGIQGGWLAD